VRIRFLLVVMTVISGAVYSQEKVDSVQSELNATLDKYSVDSLTAKLNPLPDSLLPAYRKVDQFETISRKKRNRSNIRTTHPPQRLTHHD
jgi:hypothetical protein